MTDETRDFELIEVLQFTTGYMLKDVDSIYKLADWMTGDANYTHQLPRVMDECKPFILQDHPALADVDEEALKRSLQGEANPKRLLRICREWVEQEAVRLDLPDALTLRKLPPGAHRQSNPLADFRVGPA